MISLANELRSYLVAQGIVKQPDDSGDLPVCYAQLNDGCPAPADLRAQGVDTNTVVHIERSHGAPSKPMEGRWLTRLGVLITVRSDYSPDGETLSMAQAEQVTDRISGLLDDQRQFDAGQVHIEYALLSIPAVPMPLDLALPERGCEWQMVVSLIVRKDQLGR